MTIPTRPIYRCRELRLIVAELDRAMAKFGPMSDCYEGWAVLAEEVDEFWDDVKANRTDAALVELVQVGAMGLRFTIDVTGLDAAEVIDTISRLLADNEWPPVRSTHAVYGYVAEALAEMLRRLEDFDVDPVPATAAAMRIVGWATRGLAVLGGGTAPCAT